MPEPTADRHIPAASRWRALSFGLTAEQEDRYRKASFSTDRTQAKVCMLLMLLPNVGFGFNDYAFLGWSGPLLALWAARSAFLAQGLIAAVIMFVLLLVLPNRFAYQLLASLGVAMVTVLGGRLRIAVGSTLG
jgi:hypothetical protein